jgi:hypothetical protein
MATSQAAYKAEQAIGHNDSEIIIQQDVSNYEAGAGDDGESMKALVWQGKNNVEIGMLPFWYPSQKSTTPSSPLEITNIGLQSTCPSPRSSRIEM